MALSSFEIGTTSSTTNVESLTTPLNPPRSRFIEFSKDVDLSDGSVRGGGWIKTYWIWDFMTQAQYTQLLTFCSGKSAAIYIKTMTDHGTFVKYSCTMIRPSEPKRTTTHVLNIEIEFRNLQAV